MKRFLSPFTLLIFFCGLTGSSLIAQDELKNEKKYKNTVRLNLSNPLIFGDRSLIIGYERMLKSNQSFSINIGQTALPEFDLFGPGVDSSLQLTKNSKGSGFSITGDYRFYLQKLNKHEAPRGVYIGPYVSFANLGRKNTWTLDSDSFQGEVETEMDINYFAIGAELGYQFVFWNRLSVDLVLVGPGIGFYGLKASLDTTLDPEDEQELYQKISDALNEKFPGYSFAVDDIDFQETGSSNVTSIGYRYVIHVGYRF